MSTISGTTRDSTGNLCARMVRAYRRRDGEFAGETVSNAITGEYSITALDSSAHVVYQIDGVVTPGDPDWNSVITALHMDGDDNSQIFVDEVGNSVSVTGTAKLSTDAAAFGGISALFDGTVSYLTVPLLSTIGTVDFAMTFWLKMISMPGSQKGLIGPTIGNYLFMSIGDTNLTVTPFSGTGLSFALNPVVGTRYYIEVSRVAGTMYMFTDGVLRDSRANTANFSNTSVQIGAYNSTLADMPNCRIDDFKIVKVGGHTSGYTPPIAPFLGAQTISAPTEKPQIFDNVIPI